jgi:hypothetical protein
MFWVDTSFVEELRTARLRSLVRGSRQLRGISVLAKWGMCPPINNVERLLEEEDAIAQLGVRHNGEITAAALVAKNAYRPTTTAFYYVYARNPRALRQHTAGAIDVCIRQDMGDLLIDLINAHRCFEPTYLAMGFAEVADHAMFEKAIA